MSKPATIHTDIVLTANEAHEEMTQAVEGLQSAQWAVADALHAAQSAEVWNRDGGDHVARYRLVMEEKGLPSLMAAYAYDEFGYQKSQVYDLARVGELRSIEAQSLGENRATEAASERALRPLAERAILDTYTPEQIGSVLQRAQEAAQAEGKPIQGGHIRDAMRAAEVTKPKARPEDEDTKGKAQETSAAKLKRDREAKEAKAIKAVDAAMDILTPARQRELALHVVRRLDGMGPSLQAVEAEVRQLLGEEV